MVTPGRTIMVTGGAGFIGSALVRRLIAAGHRVVTIDALTYAGTLGSLRDVEQSPGHVFHRLDINQRDKVHDILAAEQVDAIAHLAAETHVDRSIDDAGAFVSANVAGTVRMLEAALHHWRALDGEAKRDFRFLHVSTDEVYGDLGADDPPFDEDSPYRPSSPYAASKASADHFVRAFHRTHGLPVILSNCSNNFGPFQYPEKLIPLTIVNALEGKPLPLYGAGDNVRDWLFVDDHARALERLIDAGREGETYAVSARQCRTNLHIVETICDRLDRISPLESGAPRRSLIRFVEDRPGHDRRYALDPAKIERDIGWTASTDFDEAIDATIDWYCSNRWWWAPIRADYAGERLGKAR